MDDLAEFLKVYPLSDDSDNGFSSLNINVKAEHPARGSTPDFLSYNYQQQQQQQPPQPRGFTAPYQTFPSQYGQPAHSLRIPDLKALISDGQDQQYISNQVDLDPISLSQMAPHTGTRGATRAQAAHQNIHKPPAFHPGAKAEKDGSMTPRHSSLTRNRPSEPVPQMPVLLKDDGDFSDHGEDPDGGKAMRGGKVQTGRQRSSGPLSAHAIYARMNRERKKKYIADLEEYRKVMLKKRVDQRRELDSMHRETELLTQEISALRNDLVGNDVLMNLLSAGIRH